MRPIELTRIFESGKTEPFWINPDHIISFVLGWQNIGAYVSLTTASFAIKETPTEIIGRLADHRSAMHAEEHDGIEIFW